MRTLDILKTEIKKAELTGDISKCAQLYQETIPLIDGNEFRGFYGARIKAVANLLADSELDNVDLKILDDAIRLLKEIIAFPPETKYRKERAIALYLLGSIYPYRTKVEHLENHSNAVLYLEQALEYLNKMDSPEMWADVKILLAESNGILAQSQGEKIWPRVLQNLNDALSVFNSCDYPDDNAYLNKCIIFVKNKIKQP